MIYKLRDLGNRGLIKDIVPHEVPEGYFTEAVNVRFTARGVLRYPTGAVLYENGVSSAIRMAACRRGEGSKVFYARSNSLWISNGNDGFDNVGRIVGGAYAPDDWHEEVYGQTMIFNSYSNIPQAMEIGDSAFKDLPAWPSTTRTKLLRTYKAFFVAIGLLEDGIEKSNIVMWSDACYNNGLPPNWSQGDPSSFSGNATIAPGDGKLVAGHTMGDTFVIYSENSATAMQFSGNISFPMQFRELFKYGAMNRDCVGVFDRRHFVVGQDHIWVHDGVNVTLPAENRVERAIYSDISDRTRVKVVMNPSNYEASIYFRSTSDGNPYVEWIWNWRNDTWTRAELKNVYHKFYGPPEANQVLWSDWQTNGALWDGVDHKWSDLNGSHQQDVMMELLPNSIRQAYYNFDADNYQPYKTSSLVLVGIDLDAMNDFNSGVIKFVRRIYPIMSGEDTANVDFRFGSSASPDGDITWKPWQNYSLRDGVKVDTRITGRYLAIEMRGMVAEQGGWALTGLDIDVEGAGGR